MNWRDKIHEVIFEADTPLGKLFDIGLLVSIALSVLVVMLESVESVNSAYHDELVFLEWYFTIAFTIEYFLRIISVKKSSKYMFSFYGIVDVMAILPTYLSLLFPGIQFLMTVRTLRMIRIFRILKFGQFISEASMLSSALEASMRKISIFLYTVSILVIILGSLMYVVEGETSGFSSIPQSIYWAIVTLTTVGYGDIAPVTPLGKAIASVIMITGYAIIAVPTGIVTVEMNRSSKAKLNVSTQACQHCSLEGHDMDSIYCKYCGEKL